MKRLGCILLLPACLLALFMLLVAPHVFEPPLLLMFGWLFSLKRLVQAWHGNFQGMVFLLAAVALLILGGNAFARWLYLAQKRNSGDSGSTPRPWRWQWTLCGFGLGFCALVAVIGGVLTVHQIYWMWKSPDPWFTNRMERGGALSLAAQHLNRAAEVNEWDKGKTRLAFWEMPPLRSGPVFAEILQPIWVEKDEKTLKAIILVPRQKPQSTIKRFAVIQPNVSLKMEDMEALPQVLASFGIAAPEQQGGRQGALLP